MREFFLFYELFCYLIFKVFDHVGKAKQTTRAPLFPPFPPFPLSLLPSLPPSSSIPVSYTVRKVPRRPCAPSRATPKALSKAVVGVESTFRLDHHVLDPPRPLGSGAAHGAAPPRPRRLGTASAPLTPIVASPGRLPVRLRPLVRRYVTSSPSATSGARRCKARPSRRTTARPRRAPLTPRATGSWAGSRASSGASRWRATAARAEGRLHQRLGGGASKGRGGAAEARAHWTSRSAAKTATAGASWAVKLALEALATVEEESSDAFGAGAQFHVRFVGPKIAGRRAAVARPQAFPPRR